MTSQPRNQPVRTYSLERRNRVAELGLCSSTASPSNEVPHIASSFEPLPFLLATTVDGLPIYTRKEKHRGTLTTYM